MRLFLASASPRRKQLLEQAGIKFTCIQNRLDEERLPSHGSLSYKVRMLSKEKAIASKDSFEGLILGADTVVSIENTILGKPASPTEATHMLKQLSGKTHCVVSAIALFDTKKSHCITRSATSQVTFNPLTDNDISTYIRDKKPFDKAGSYGIQDIPAHFLKEYTGQYETILGLPLKELLQILHNYAIV